MEPDAHRSPARHEPGQAPLPNEAARPAPGGGPLRLTFLLVLLSAVSCGYGLSTRQNPHIKTVAVPIFLNETLEKGIEEVLTAELIDVLQENRSLTLTGERNADSVLHGKVIEYQRAPSSYDQNEEVQEYKISIVIAVEYEDRVKGKTLWTEPRMLGWATYYVVPAPGHEVEEEEDAQLRAIEKLAEDIKTRTVEGW